MLWYLDNESKPEVQKDIRLRCPLPQGQCCLVWVGIGLNRERRLEDWCLMLSMWLAPSYCTSIFCEIGFLTLGNSAILPSPTEGRWVHLEVRKEAHASVYMPWAREWAFFIWKANLWPWEAQGGREGRNPEARAAEEAVCLHYPSWDGVLAAAQGLSGGIQGGSHYAFQSETSVFRTVCIPSTPLDFPAKSLFSKSGGGGVGNKGSSSWQAVPMGEERCAQGCCFKDTWNHSGALGLQLSGGGRSCWVYQWDYEKPDNWQFSFPSWEWRQMGRTQPPEGQANKYSHFIIPVSLGHTSQRKHTAWGAEPTLSSHLGGSAGSHVLSKA